MFAVTLCSKAAARHLGGDAAPRIFPRGDRLKMVWVYTTSHTTTMIKLKAIWYCSTAKNKN
jgi:hypothetical protein